MEVLNKTEKDFKIQAEEIMDGRKKLSPREFAIALLPENAPKKKINAKQRYIQQLCKNRAIHRTPEGRKYFFYSLDVIKTLQYWDKTYDRRRMGAAC